LASRPAFEFEKTSHHTKEELDEHNSPTDDELSSVQQLIHTDPSKILQTEKEANKSVSLHLPLPPNTAHGREHPPPSSSPQQPTPGTARSLQTPVTARGSRSPSPNGDRLQQPNTARGTGAPTLTEEERAELEIRKELERKRSEREHEMERIMGMSPMGKKNKLPPLDRGRSFKLLGSKSSVNLMEDPSNRPRVSKIRK
jgi:hypothetical protein